MMDKLEQLRRLTGHVEKAGRRAVDLDRVQSKAERELEAAQFSLRALHEELTNPSGKYDPVEHGDSAGEIEAATRHPHRPWTRAKPEQPASSHSKFKLMRLALLLLTGAGIAGAALAMSNQRTGKASVVTAAKPGTAEPGSGKTAVASAKVAAKPAPPARTSQPSPVTTVRPEAPPESTSVATRTEPAGVATIAIMMPANEAQAAISVETAAIATGSTVAAIPSASVVTPQPEATTAAPAATTDATALDATPAELVAPYAKRFVGISATERECLAQAVYYEARGEPVAGQIAVAQVILNRSMSSSWPNTICGVVRQGEESGEKCQFSFACMKRSLSAPHGEPWQQASWVSNEVLSGGAWLRELLPATHYHRTDLAPVWRLALKEIGRIGSHMFYGPPGTTQVLALEVAGDGGAAQKVAGTPNTAGRAIAKRSAPPQRAKADTTGNEWSRRALGQ